MANNIIIDVNPNLQVWNERAPKCATDLRIKKFVYSLICLMNLSGIVGLLTYITMNYPIPSIEGAYFLTPFIGGVIAALLLLKIPTYGINHMTYRNLTNLPLLVSEGIALLFFGPTVLARNAIDWNDYADPYEAARIKREIEELPLEEAIAKYGPRVSNLEKYGYISREQAETFKELYENNKEHLKAYEILCRDPEVKKRRSLPLELIQALDDAKTTWDLLKGGLRLPEPELRMPTITCWDRFPSFYYARGANEEVSEERHRARA